LFQKRDRVDTLVNSLGYTAGGRHPSYNQGNGRQAPKGGGQNWHNQPYKGGGNKPRGQQQFGKKKPQHGRQWSQDAKDQPSSGAPPFNKGGKNNRQFSGGQGRGKN
jgi:hypothetical protein